MSETPTPKPTPKQQSQTDPKRPKAPEIRPDTSTQGSSKKSADMSNVEGRQSDREQKV